MNLTGHENSSAHPKTGQWFSSPSLFSLFFSLTLVLVLFCGLITLLYLHVVFCPNKQRSFELFMCLDLAQGEIKMNI